ncbi:MAG TPA: DUF4760 domain-containing protein [Hyphomicrobiales bacterium]|nr:DUF4760 domain-containing protein [Hyphomicrobiales bacterium]
MSAEAWIILGTGIVAALIAFWGVMSQRAISRRLATIEHISELESDRDMIDARQRFIELAKGNGGLEPFAEEDKERDPDTQKIKIVLNDFELIAIGIQLGIFDEELYARWHKTGAMQFWHRAQPFVMRLRARIANDQIYREYEAMVGRFKRGSGARRRGWRFLKFR